MPKKVEISHRTIVFTAAFLAALWVITKIWDIILLLFISVILMAALKPAVDRLEQLKIPRSLAIIFIYLILWVFVGTVVASLIPPLVDQTRKLVSLLPQALSNVDYLTNHQQDITTQVLSSVGTLPERIFKFTVGIFGNFLNVVTTIVISFYLLLERKNLDSYIIATFGTKSAPEVKKIIVQIETHLGNWVRGQLALMSIIGLMTYFGLRLLGLDTALPLALLAGILEIVPSIGPLVSAIPAVIIALVVHPLMGLSVAALYFLIQFLENNLIVPQVMRRATGVNPLLGIISLMVGFRLAGVAGAVLAIPVVLVIQTLGLRFFSLSRLEDLSDTD